MRHFPIFVDLAGQRIAVFGGGETAVAKIRLLLKSDGQITVFSQAPGSAVRAWAAEGIIEPVHAKACL